MADFFSSLTDTGVAASSGNPLASVSAITSLLSGVLAGHSDWWKFDNSYNGKDFNTVANFIILWGQNGTAGSNGGNLAGASVDMVGYKGRPRYLVIPEVYGATHNQQLLPIWDSYYRAGLLSQAPPEANGVQSPNNLLTMLGFSPSVGASLNPQNSTPLYSNLSTPSNNGGLSSSPILFIGGGLLLLFLFNKRK